MCIEATLICVSKTTCIETTGHYFIEDDWDNVQEEYLQNYRKHGPRLCYRATFAHRGNFAVGRDELLFLPLFSALAYPRRIQFLGCEHQ